MFFFCFAWYSVCEKKEEREGKYVSQKEKKLTLYVIYKTKMLTLKDEEILDEEVPIYSYVYDRKIKIFHERDVVRNA